MRSEPKPPPPASRVRTIQRQAREVFDAYQAGRTAEISHIGPIRGLAILHELIDRGALGYALDYAANKVDGSDERVESLKSVLEKAPRKKWLTPKFVDDPQSDLQIVQRRTLKARPVILVFTGVAQRFSRPLTLVHAWFGQLPAHIIYVRDIHRICYLAGLRSFGSDYETTVAGLKEIAAKLGARSIHCVGTSSGAFGALRMGIDLGAKSVLCIAGPTKLDGLLDDYDLVVRSLGRPLASDNLADLNLRTKLLGATDPPAVRHIHGADNPTDREEGQNLSGINGVELLEIAGWSRHNLLDGLFVRDELPTHLNWLLRYR